MFKDVMFGPLELLVLDKESKMIKITSKLYPPKNLLEVINAVEKILLMRDYNVVKGSDIVIDLRKMGYKIVKVDDGE